MVSGNWFSDCSVSKGTGNENLPPLGKGKYAGVLIDVRPGEGKAYKDGGEPRKTLTFRWTLDNGRSVIRTVTPNNALKSACMDLVLAMAGDRDPGLSVLTLPHKLQQFILGMVGDRFIVTIEPSACGKYNNVVAVSPETEAAA